VFGSQDDIEFRFDVVSSDDDEEVEVVEVK
jgi:hypothetical protein